MWYRAEISITTWHLVLFLLYFLSFCKWFPSLGQKAFEMDVLCYIFIIQDYCSIIYSCRYIFIYSLSYFSDIMLILPSFLCAFGTEFTSSCICSCFLCFCDLISLPGRLNQLVLFLRLSHCIYLFFYYRCFNYVNKPPPVSQCATPQNLLQMLCCHAY